MVTRDPENVKAIFVTHASSFEISSHRYYFSMAARNALDRGLRIFERIQLN